MNFPFSTFSIKMTPYAMAQNISAPKREKYRSY